MHFKLVFFTCFIYICHTASSLNLRATGDVGCEEIGDKSNVICVTRTEFVLGFQDPEEDPPLSCKSGEVCANHVNICVPEGLMEPACRNTVLGGEGCRSCRADAEVNEPVCVSLTEFSLCRDCELDTDAKFACGGVTPYCHAVYDDTPIKLTSICTARKQDADCPA